MAVRRITSATTQDQGFSQAQLNDLYRSVEAFRSIAIAWESIASGAWSLAAIRSFAALARRVALDLSTVGCGALDQAVIELVLALDGITVAGTLDESLMEQVDHALAKIRGVTVQRVLALDFSAIASEGGSAPVLMSETCPRCAAHAICTLVHARREHQMRV
ncbi:hypothetical protein [Candidatus Chloroploca asiatica]|uniref:Uncharacterized protein n=1 Tax=Candidatus Chloroploca asiatica TaxID=1506545 RepID=A0A2H3KHY4_9CHLR|nr:hypothetical protein [Candidatus Chloroploca asiatica]PDV97425.1 hypothetical protein A9Q02_18410 [Candidatus Chloroploca asiatica]